MEWHGGRAKALHEVPTSLSTPLTPTPPQPHPTPPTQTIP